MNQGILILLVILLIWVLSPPSHAAEYSLNDLYRMAIDRSERIKISEEDIYISEAEKDKARAALFPKLSTFGSYTRYSTDRWTQTGLVIQPVESTSWGLRLDQSLSLSGREFIYLNISRHGIEKAKYDIQAIKEDYLLGVAESYYDVLKASRALEIAKANIERLKRHRDAAAVRLRAGEITKTDLLRAEAELSGAQAEMTSAENNLKLSKAILARLTGLKGDFEVSEVRVIRQDCDKQQCLPPELLSYCHIDLTLDCLKDAAFHERPELKGISIQKKILEEQIRYSKAAYWPSLFFQGMYLRRKEDPASVFLNKESLYAGLTLNFPLFEGGLRGAEVRETESRLRQTELLYEEMSKNIDIDVEKSYLEVMTRKEVLKSLEDQLKYARDNYKTVSRQYELGLINSIDVIDANTLYVTAERQLSNAIYNYELSLIRLERVTGVLLKTVKR